MILSWAFLLSSNLGAGYRYQFRAVSAPELEKVFLRKTQLCLHVAMTHCGTRKLMGKLIYHPLLMKESKQTLSLYVPKLR